MVLRIQLGVSESGLDVFETICHSDEENNQKRWIYIRTEQGGFLVISLFAPVLDFFFVEICFCSAWIIFICVFFDPFLIKSADTSFLNKPDCFRTHILTSEKKESYLM